jgi:hypothetical protein
MVPALEFHMNNISGMAPALDFIFLISELRNSSLLKNPPIIEQQLWDHFQRNV